MLGIRGNQIIGAATVLLGLTLLEKAFGLFTDPLPTEQHNTAAIIGGIFAVFGLCSISGRLPKTIRLPFVDVDLGPEDPISSVQHVEKAKLNPQEKEEKARFASSLHLPTHGAPPFRILTEKAISEVELWPGADPSLPMYTLDKDYRIIDWNKAFSLAFDRSMEGLRGQFVTEWVYHLENYQEVLKHGEAAFANQNDLPRIDVEDIRFISKRYKGLSATKRAYQIPDDTGACAGWLIILDLRFDNDEVHGQYQLDLIQLQRMDLLWSEYSVVFDRVLCNTKVYRELLSEMIEGKNGDRPIRPATTILDLGAGTGNISEILSDPKDGRSVVAVDNNRTMLNILKWKCDGRLTNDIGGPGVTIIKQDILSLYGLDDDYFDYVVANNVFYSLGSSDAIQSCMEEVYRVLKPSGEIRLSGPKKSTSLDSLFSRIKKDLKKAGKFEELKEDFARVEDINKRRLSPFLFNFDPDDMKTILKDVGFPEIVYASDQAYDGEAMMIFARK